MIILDRTLSIDAAMNIVRFGEKLEFSENAINRVKKCSSKIDEAIDNGIKIYGVTTGLGANVTENISREETRVYQERILKSHAVSVGEPISEEELRAIILMIILNGIKGYSGVRIETLNLLKEFLNRNLYVYVPGNGSVGYLNLEAHIGLALIGEGKIFKDGEFKNSRDVLESLNLKPLELSYKEALFIISGTTSVTAYGLLNIYDAEIAFENFKLISAMSVEVNLATTRAFDKRLMEVRKQIEQQEVARDILEILKDSKVCEQYYNKSLQNSLSIRCIPQLAGAVLKKINEAKLTILREMDSSTDNPIIYIEDGKVDAISGCNPDSSYVGLEMECIGIALTMLAKMSERRTFRLLDEKLSNKPAFLVENSGSNSGLMITQYTQAGLLNQMKGLCTANIVDSIPTCANQEDYTAMGFNSVKKLRKILDNLKYILAIELLAIYEANYYVDENLKRSSKTNELYNKLKFIPRLREDIKLHPYIEELRKMMDTNLI